MFSNAEIIQIEKLKEFSDYYHNAFKVFKTSPLRQKKELNKLINNWPSIYHEDYRLPFSTGRG
ncbi:MAG: hypothetical protein HC896_18040 [Bacteroidales bacterium]|nr:hypothetical protein [Bacteroidales bacterium]